MSSYLNQRTGQNIDRPLEMNSAAKGLEDLLHHVKRLEAAVGEERSRNRQLEDDLRRTQDSYHKVLEEVEGKKRLILSNETQLRGDLTSTKKRLETTTNQAKLYRDEYEKVAKELKQYRSAWKEVVEREKEANRKIKETDQIRFEIKDLKEKNKILVDSFENEKKERDQFERHSKSYQKELQNALVRLHSSQTKFNELQQEIQVLNQRKTDVQTEVKKIENSIRERYEWALNNEREKIKANIQKEASIEVEKFKNQERERVKGEINQTVSEYSRRIVDLEKQLETAQREQLERERTYHQKLSEYEKLGKELKKEIEYRERIERELEDTKEANKEDIVAFEARFEALKTELNDYKTRLRDEREIVRKEMEKDLESERKSFRDELEEKKSKYKRELAEDRKNFKEEIERAQTTSMNTIRVLQDEFRKQEEKHREEINQVANKRTQEIEDIREEKDKFEGLYEAEQLKTAAYEKRLNLIETELSNVEERVSAEYQKELNTALVTAQEYGAALVEMKKEQELNYEELRMALVDQSEINFLKATLDAREEEVDLICTVLQDFPKREHGKKELKELHRLLLDHKNDLKEFLSSQRIQQKNHLNLIEEAVNERLIEAGPAEPLSH